VTQTLRLVSVAWWLNVKQLMRSSFDSLLAILWPIFFATVAFLHVRGRRRSGCAHLRGPRRRGDGHLDGDERRRGIGAPARALVRDARTPLVAAPAHFSLVLLPLAFATSAIGIYCMATTLLWGRFVFGIDLTFEEPLLLALAIPATILSIGALGFLIAVSFARYRFAWALGSLTEYPIWLICGFLVPLTLLPDWMRPISYALAPTWGMRAIRECSTGGSPLPDVAMCFLLGSIYVALGVLITNGVLRAARRSASLSLT